MRTMEMEIVFVMLCALSYASGVSRCWSCDDTTCNDPFNSQNAVIMNCTNPNSYRSVATDEWGNGGDVLFRKYNNLYTSTTDFVCVKYAVNRRVNPNNNFTVRFCSPRTINGQNTCDVITQTVGASTGVVTSCVTCENDLCNSATRWSFSVLALVAFGSLGYVLH